ncbi:MAG: hypothetical protein SPE72_04020, partial [Alloprevotella sp.]|nr:hypothetical protein [Alloprevotella sp.]
QPSCQSKKQRLQELQLPKSSNSFSYFTVFIVYWLFVGGTCRFEFTKIHIKSEKLTPCRVDFQQWSHLTPNTQRNSILRM